MATLRVVAVVSWIALKLLAERGESAKKKMEEKEEEEEQTRKKQGQQCRQGRVWPMALTSCVDVRCGGAKA